MNLPISAHPSSSVAISDNQNNQWQSAMMESRRPSMNLPTFTNYSHGHSAVYRHSATHPCSHSWPLSNSHLLPLLTTQQLTPSPTPGHSATHPFSHCWPNLRHFLSHQTRKPSSTNMS